MKNTFKFILSAALVIPAFAKAQDDKLAKLENRLAELEAQQSLNIFTFGGLLETRYDNYKANNTTYGGNTASDSNVDFLRYRASFDVNANVSKDIKVYTRYTMSKFGNLFYSTNTGASTVGTAPITNPDLSAAKGENGAGVYVEKFYADVTIPDTGMVFSFGRLPTADGPPFNQANGRPRTGTYPGLLYNAELDGLAISYNRPVGDGTLALRAVTTPFQLATTAQGKLQGTGVTTNPNGNQKTMQPLDTAMIEYSTNKLSFAENFSVIGQAYRFNTAVLGADFNAGGGAGSGVTDISINASALYIGLDNIMKTGLDLSVTYLQSKLENNSVMTVPGAGSLGYGGTTVGSAQDSSTLATARYKVNSKTFVGVEYLSGGKQVFVYDSNSDNLSGFYNTPGTASNTYALYKFTSELGLRLGYINQNYTAANFTFGTQKNSDKSVQNVYANLRLDF